jgi:hypothetical protein
MSGWPEPGRDNGEPVGAAIPAVNALRLGWL